MKSAGLKPKFVQNYDAGLEARALSHIVENWDSIPQRIKDLKKTGGSNAKKPQRPWTLCPTKPLRHSLRKTLIGKIKTEHPTARL